MSSNFFAALDDSGDEGPKASNTKGGAIASKKGAGKGGGAVEPSKVDQRKRPNQHDRNTKHGRGGRAPTRDGKRAYDRRSGTGRGKETKKSGGGARNWGSDKADAKQMEGTYKEGENDGNNEDKPTSNYHDNETEEAEAPAPVPDNTVTFADYMASKGKKEETKLRSVNNEFENAMAKVSVQDDFCVMGSGGKQKKNKANRQDNRKKVEVNFRTGGSNANSGDGGRGRGGGRYGDRDGRGGGRSGDRDGRGGGRYGDRDGRGGGRGRGDRGGGRFGRGDRGGGRFGRGDRGGGRGRGRGRGGGRGLNVQDKEAFPSL